MLQGKEFVAIPAGSWYNFNKVAQYKQLTLEEAEEKMKNRRKTADGYQRWMMEAANNGPAAFGEVEKFEEKEGGTGGGRGRKKTSSGDDDEANVSDRGEEDEDEESARKNRLGLNKRSGDDDEEGPRGGDLDLDDDDIEKGDDWEHEEIFTDDDEAVGNDPEEREDLAPEIPAPPEIKQDEEDEDETNEEEEGGLSKSGKELKKLLGRSGGLSDSDPEDDDDMEDDISPVLAPKQKDAPKEEPVDNSPLKSASSGSARGTPTTSKSAKGKRKVSGDDAKANNGAPPKKVKTENEVKPSKEETVPTSKSSVPAKCAPSSTSKTASTPSTGPVTEDEIRALLMQKTSVTTQDLVAKFKSRLKGKEDKDAFAAIVMRISKIQKTNGPNYVVLRENSNEVKPSKEETVPTSKSSVPAKCAPSSTSKTASTPSTGPVTEDEIRAVLMQKTPVTTQDLVAKFKSRLKGKEDKDAFAAILRRISKIQKTNGPNYVVLRER